MLEGALGSRHSVPKIEAPYRFAAGDIIGSRYFVRGTVGQGGMGHVMRVQDQVTRQVCALKYCSEDRFHRRFAREVRIMERIESPYVIRILDSNLNHDPPYFVMPMGECSLESELLRKRGDENAILNVFSQICFGVRDIHERGIFHRDLKPANILKLRDAQVVVSDLGLACFEVRDTSVLTTTIQRLGTEDYLAPEQMQPDDETTPDTRTDIYQLGKLLYCLLTGSSPRFINIDKVPRGLAHIIERATAVNPQRRYPNVAGLEAAIKQYREAKDPEKNPREALECQVREIEGRHLHTVPPASEIEPVLRTLSYGRWLENDLLIQCFHLLPLGWLPVIAKVFEAEFQPILEAYATSIQAVAGGYNWDFADTVCERMKAIYDNSSVIATKVLALRALMIAADKLGRYAPQSTFCNYLQKVNVIELALPIAEMIIEYGAPSVKAFRGCNIPIYHVTIQAALNGLSHQTAELDRSGKCIADMKVLKQIYRHLAAPLVIRFINEALEDRIHHEILTEIDPAADLVNSTSFTLHDKKLLELLRNFFNEWLVSSTWSEGIYHDYANEGVATVVDSIRMSSDLLERRMMFHKYIIKAGEAFSALNTYVRATFPQFNIDEFDKVGFERYEQWKSRLDRQVLHDK